MSQTPPQEKGHEPRDMDVTAAGRGVWLVKVPKYLAEKWEDPKGSSEVGKLCITRSASKIGNAKPEVVFTSSEAIVPESGSSLIPRHHKFSLTGVSNQNMVVISQPDTLEKISVEGKIIQRVECHPIADANYMKLKRSQLELNNKPKREIKLLQNVVTTYKPRSDHASMFDDKKKNKNAEKRSRLDKERVMDMLFAAFEKHQYYNVKDLVGITKQPIPYLKEILQEICVYNMKAPHRNMWELKPEFRHYKKDDSS